MFRDLTVTFVEQFIQNVKHDITNGPAPGEACFIRRTIGGRGIQANHFHGRLLVGALPEGQDMEH